MIKHPLPAAAIAISLALSSFISSASFARDVDMLNIGPITPAEKAPVEPATAELPTTTPDSPGRRSGDARAASAAPAADAVKALIAKHAGLQGVPVWLADAVVRIESRYNPNARNGVHMGLTQINHRTARSLGFSGAPSALLEPDTNLRYGLKYLGDAYKLADGDVCGTILRYQAGHRAVQMTAAARAYCSKVKLFTASASAAKAQ